MSWLIDNANVAYIILGIIALGFITAWWLNKRMKFLAYAGIVVLLIGAVWLLAHLLPTDRKEIQETVQTMADAVVRGDQNELFKHVARDFRYKQLNREQLAAVLKAIAVQQKISGVRIWEFEFEEVSREKRQAKAQFKATVFDSDGSVLALVLCLATFTHEDNQWKLRAIDFRNAANPDQPMPGAP